LKEKLDESIEKLSMAKVPKITLSPLAASVLLSLAILAQMAIQGTPIPRRPPKDTAPTGPSADGTGESPAEEQPVQSSPQGPKLSLVEGDGFANGADSSSSDD
jgi:hypothetical protein